MLELMSGNEAIARGAWECGATFGAGYPGTPSTEILEAFAQYKGVYAEWSPNEKVGLEVAIGASFAGARAMAVMKHVGVNVAADPLFTVSYTGTNGALVIVTADDPSLHSSQNEQDNRNYAKFAKVPMLEPADSQEAKDFVKLAFELSERFDTPVFLRTTTRVSHSKSVVRLEPQRELGDRTEIKHLPLKYVMVPINARARRVEVEKRTQALREWAETFPGNRVEMGSPDVGIITAGMPYNYAKDVFPDYSYLKLGLVNPLPERLIRAFASKVKKLYVVEELDPFIEEQVRAMGIEVTGKAVFPYTNEFDPGVIERGVTGRLSAPAVTTQAIPPRPPNLCPGCPHRGLFYALNKTKAFVSGDIGCYTLSYMKPLSGMDSCICMGASIGIAHGMSRALGPKGKGKVVGVIGDSTFIHSGITALLNAAYNGSDAVFIIADNRTTAMTGMQEHPATGYTLQGEKAKELDFAALGKVLGVESVEVIDPLQFKNTAEVLKRELQKDGPSLLIARSPCVLLMSKKAARARHFVTDPDKCIGCKVCLSCGCPAISWKDFEKAGLPPRPERKKQKGIAVIDAALCTGCTFCAQLCRQEAIMREDG
ncbi:MAG: indolepyruvate ferredoxin oxidoreductase subunit alpha [Syntrophaceae bacterium]|nr:indolepyruvate ferredoxin oxidoreductase subunit alpha [Syntrophaceae bacterium]